MLAQLGEGTSRSEHSLSPHTHPCSPPVDKRGQCAPHHFLVLDLSPDFLLAQKAQPGPTLLAQLAHQS